MKTSDGSPKRPTDITVAAAVLLIGISFIIITMFAALLVSYKTQPLSIFSETDYLRRLSTILPQLAVAMWGLATAIGLIRLRHWARISMLVISVMAVYYFLLRGLTASTVVLSSDSSEYGYCNSPGGIYTFLGLTALAVLSVVHFSQQSTGSMFHNPERGVETSTAPSPTLEWTSPGGTSSRDRGQLGQIVIGTWLLTAWPLTSYSVLFNLSRFLPFPLMPLGNHLQGSAKVAYTLAMAGAGIVVGGGLIAKRPWAQIGTILLCIFTIISEFLPVLQTKGFVSATDFFGSTASSIISYPGFWVLTLWKILPMAAALLLIAKRKQLTV